MGGGGVCVRGSVSLSALMRNRMSDQGKDPPATLAEAEARFGRFLAENGFPSEVRWILPDQIALGDERNYLLCAQGASDGRKEAERRYSLGLERGLGICLHAICATNTTTIASVYVPTDQLDAQYHLMGPLLKLTCPTEKLPAWIVDDPSAWDALGFDVQFRSKIMREAFEL